MQFLDLLFLAARVEPLAEDGPVSFAFSMILGLHVAVRNECRQLLLTERVEVAVDVPGRHAQRGVVKGAIDQEACLGEVERATVGFDDVLRCLILTCLFLKAMVVVVLLVERVKIE